MALSSWSWLLVGDSSGARIFKFDNPAEPWTLVVTVREDGAGTPEGTRDFGKKASLHKGALHGHGDNEHSEKETGERRLAHRLAHLLERGLSDGAFGRLLLVAEPRLLGELRENLSRGLQQTIVAALSGDYVHLNARELQARLSAELPPDLTLRA